MLLDHRYKGKDMDEGDHVMLHVVPGELKVQSERERKSINDATAGTGREHGLGCAM